ncbi:hypothetical protein D3C76_1575690 [compost metagenome]
MSHSTAGGGPVQAAWLNHVLGADRVTVRHPRLGIEKQVGQRRNTGMVVWRKGRRVHPVVVDPDEGRDQRWLGAQTVTVEMAAYLGAI